MDVTLDLLLIVGSLFIIVVILKLLQGMDSPRKFDRSAEYNRSEAVDHNPYDDDRADDDYTSVNNVSNNYLSHTYRSAPRSNYIKGGWTRHDAFSQILHEHPPRSEYRDGDIVVLNVTFSPFGHTYCYRAKDNVYKPGDIVEVLVSGMPKAVTVESVGYYSERVCLTYRRGVQRSFVFAIHPNRYDMYRDYIDSFMTNGRECHFRVE